jgi:hypothetical protein
MCDTDSRGLSEPGGVRVWVVAIFFFTTAYDCSTCTCWVHSERDSAKWCSGNNLHKSLVSHSLIHFDVILPPLPRSTMGSSSLEDFTIKIAEVSKAKYFIYTYFPFHHVHLLMKSAQIWWIPAMAISSTSLSDSSRGDVPQITLLDTRHKSHGEEITCSVNCAPPTRSEPWTPLPTSVLTCNVCKLIWNCERHRFNNLPLKLFKTVKAKLTL